MRQIPPFELRPILLNHEAGSLGGFEWAGAEIGKRHRLGGALDFLQGSDTPICVCKKLMTSHAQLDGVNDEFCSADCALIYVLF